MKKLHSIISAILLTCSVSYAQPVQLTVEDAVQKSITTSKLLRVSESKVTQANAKIEETNSTSLPSVTLSGGYTRLSNVPVFTFDNASTITGLLSLLNALPGSSLQGQFSQQYINTAGDLVRAQGATSLFPAILDQTQFRLSAQQVLFAGGKIDAGKDIAKYSFNAAKLDVENDKLTIVYATRQTYWQLYKALEVKKSLQESAKQLKARIADAEILQKGGMITNNEVLKLKVSLSNLNVQILEVETQIRSAMVALNNLTGMPLPTVIELASQPTNSNTVSGDATQLISNAQKQRPDVLANEQRINMAKAGVDVSSANWYPTVAVTGNVLYANPNQRYIPSKQQFDATWDVGVNFQWNVWNWMATSHQTAQSQAQLIQAEEGTKAMKDNIAVEVMQNYMSLNPSMERIKVADESIAQAQENYSVTSNKYKAGTATSTDVIEAETLLLQTKINKISAIVDYELALAKLKKSLGE